MKGFQKSQNEPIFYVLKKGASVLIVSLYVDDLIFTDNDETIIQDFKIDMMNTYEVSDLGLAISFWELKYLKQKIEFSFLK